MNLAEHMSGVPLDVSFLSDFFLGKTEYIALELGQRRSRGPTSHHGAPPCLWAHGGPPPILLCSSIFYLFHKKSP